MRKRVLRTGVTALTLSALMSTFGGAALAGGGGGGGGGGSFGSAPSSNTPDFNPAQLYREGVQQYRAGDFRAAERNLKKVASVARNDANTQYMLGLSQSAQEKWRPATGSFRKAVRNNPEMHQARAELGIAYLQRDKPEKAAEQMAELEQRLVTCADACDAALTGAVEKLRAAMDPGTSAEETARLYQPVPVSATAASGDAAYLDAIRLINLGEYDTALDELQEARAAFGPHPDVLTYIGFANRKSGNYEQAIIHYTAALNVAPDHLAANEYLGEYYVELGRIDDARTQLEKLDGLCDFGCAEADELRSWIAKSEAS
ncbi:MAG: tetratricopeptide repeat protein [Pseudomonadota bacterium]